MLCAPLCTTCNHSGDSPLIHAEVLEVADKAVLKEGKEGSMPVGRLVGHMNPLPRPRATMSLRSAKYASS